MYPPWKDVSYDMEENLLVFRDLHSMDVIQRFPGASDYWGHREIKEIYEEIRRTYLEGYAQGIQDKTNELRAVLGVY